MSYPNNTNRAQNRPSTDASTPPVANAEDIGGDGVVHERTTTPKTDSDGFIGKEKLLEQFYDQLRQFEEWNNRRDWLAFHHHHYDWWMFPIDEVSSRRSAYQLPDDVLKDLRKNEKFIADLRRGVCLMVCSWGWDIDERQLFDKKILDDKQKWSYWPVRLYKAGKCMWLFNQNDYYQSLKDYAYYIKDEEKEKLDFFSRRKDAKANVLEEWDQMEGNRAS